MPPGVTAMQDASLPWEIRIDTGSLAVRTSSLDRLEVFYRPSDERLAELGCDTSAGHSGEVKLLEVELDGHYITMFPTNMVSREKFLQPKYTQIQDITVRLPLDADFPSTEDDILDLLDDLPSCFVKDFNYGLGFTQKHRHIARAIEELSDCVSVFIGRDFHTFTDTKRHDFYLSSADLDHVRRGIDRVVTTARNVAAAVNSATVYNFLAERVGEPEVPVRFGRSPLRKALTSKILQGDHFLPEDEQELFLDVLGANARQLAVGQPKRVALVQQELELANLDTIITRYEQMMHEREKEEAWQRFFSDNPFILSMGFGYPVVLVQEQAFIGGRDVSGKGDKIADFLFKNKITNNSAIVELKTPQAALLSSKVFRRGVYGPHKELVEGLSQILDQKHRFEGEIAQIQRNSKRQDFETYSVRCCLLIGMAPEGEAQRKALELFRGNSKDVEVVTFDELLEKLRELRSFLQPETVERQA